MSTPAEKANLARIRDNQRRSRARRKEYLQELEQRLRLCELQGIEASAEIQLAARKVAEENKKLRSLLHKHGINDDSIDAFLQAGIVAPPGDTSVPSQFRSAAPGNAVQALEHLLGPRRPSCIDPNAAFCPVPPGVSATAGGGSSVGGGASLGMTQQMNRSRETSVTSVATLWDAPPSQHGHAVSGNLSNQSSRRSTGRADAALALQGLGTMLENTHAPGSSMQPSTSPAESQTHQAYSYEMPLAHSPSSYNPMPRQQQKNALPNQPYRNPAMGSHYIATTAPPAASMSNGCTMNVDILSMAGVDHHVRASLGGMPGADCEVDNMVFSNSIDRYTATTIGM